MKKAENKGSYTIEASVYVPMIMFMMLAVLRSGITFYQESRIHKLYEGLTEIDAVQEFYIYQMIEEIGKEWVDD